MENAGKFREFFGYLLASLALIKKYFSFYILMGIIHLLISAPIIVTSLPDEGQLQTTTASTLIVIIISSIIQLSFFIIQIMHIERSGHSTWESIKQDISENLPNLLLATFLTVLFITFYMFLFGIIAMVIITITKAAMAQSIIFALIIIPAIALILRYAFIPHYVLLKKQRFLEAKNNSINLGSGYKLVLFLYFALIQLPQSILEFIVSKLVNIELPEHFSTIIQMIWQYPFTLTTMLMLYAFWKSKEKRLQSIS